MILCPNLKLGLFMLVCPFFCQEKLVIVVVVGVFTGEKVLYAEALAE